MQKQIIEDNSPLRLIKYFKEKSWAENFINGNIYMKDFDYYRKCEESDKGDPLEYCYGRSETGTATALKNNEKFCQFKKNVI